ncbi:MAG: transcriptional regulator EpsA [Candidatus Parcubacteria bacterium]|nr:transcriptional regulator EpsA [Burkholderiales bacterium]
MTEEATLNEIERERFASVIESSLRVYRLSHFFVWTQGEIQALLPHEILIFGMNRSPGSRIAFQQFASTRYFRDSHFAEVCRPGNGLMEKLMTHWTRTGDPCLVARGGGAGAQGQAGWIEIAEENELRNIAAHGMRSGDGRICSFFSFSRVGGEIDARLAFRLRLLTPHLHETLARVLLAESQGTIRMVRAEIRVTDRETEILRWIRDGKTNRDIAEILGLSHYTVKNHIKKITKKMGVANRSHAVARAFSMGILLPADR